MRIRIWDPFVSSPSAFVLVFGWQKTFWAIKLDLVPEVLLRRFVERYSLALSRRTHLWFLNFYAFRVDAEEKSHQRLESRFVLLLQTNSALNALKSNSKYSRSEEDSFRALGAHLEYLVTAQSSAQIGSENLSSDIFRLKPNPSSVTRALSFFESKKAFNAACFKWGSECHHEISDA